MMSPTMARMTAKRIESMELAIDKALAILESLEPESENPQKTINIQQVYNVLLAAQNAS